MMMRTVMTLFVSVFTTFVPTTVAWAQEEEEEEGIVYYDPTAPEGEQMKRTVEYTTLSEDTFEDNSVLEDGKWYYVDDYVWIYDRITVNGTVNIILGDGCTLEVQKGIEVPEDQTLNIYAQSAGDDRGSLVASIGEGDDSHNGRDAAIGGHGKNDDQFYGYYGQSAGTINIFGGNIEVHGDMGGGDGGTCIFDDDAEEFFRRSGGGGGDVDNISIYGGYIHVYGNMGGGNGAKGWKETNGGNGGDGHVNIYGGDVCVDGSIGGGYGGESEEGYDGENGGGDITLSWTNPDSDRIFIHSFNNSAVTFQKEFVNENDEDVMYEGWYWNGDIEDDIAFIPLNIPRYTITLAGSYNPPCLEFDHNQAREDEEIELLVVNGYHVTNMTVTTEDGHSVEVDINEDYEDGDVWSFIMPAQNVIVSAVATREKFFIGWKNENIDIDNEEEDRLYAPGTTINFTVDVEDYLQLQSAYYCYTDNDGYHEEYCNITSDGICSFVMPAHDVTLKTTRQQIAFNIHYDTNKMKVSSDPVVIDEDYYKTGSKVTVSNVSIPDGLIIKSFKVTQADNTAVSCTDNQNGSYTFLMPSSDVTIHVIYGTDDMTLLVGPEAFTVTRGCIYGVEGDEDFVEYTMGKEDNEEGPTRLLDGKYTEDDDSKWCLEFKEYDENHPCFVEFHTAKPVIPNQYVLITGNDTEEYAGRNPRNWKIKAKNEGDANWTVIAEVNNDATMKDKNFASYTFNFNNASNKAYQYFRFEITAIADEEAEVMQLEEMLMLVKDNAASGITTGIENMEHSPSAIDHYYYDLQGRRVEHPTKGLYIVNGRKVVVE